MVVNQVAQLPKLVLAAVAAAVGRHCWGQEAVARADPATGLSHQKYSLLPSDSQVVEQDVLDRALDQALDPFA